MSDGGKVTQAKLQWASEATDDQVETLTRQLETWIGDHAGLLVEWDVEILEEVERP